ncbi:uncharacterized protein DFL_007314 [Arthrobotrys flagrans]|uniref:OPA3-like protein n=1 Tax=Arthrobotrys flagrans TaxID=97331 RepID=A0A436ZVC0_ARTFL|nr:hypothetical protein DFL_007314 [Arthrobotrys flagrans]
MSTIAVKLTSLAVRTLAKPIANSIKQQAKEHPRFRSICIALAQAIHRTDIRIRLNLLRDNSAIERAEEDEERRKALDKGKDEKGEISKLATEAFKNEKQDTLKASSKQPDHPISHSNSSDSDAIHATPPIKKKNRAVPHIRPLSDSKAIERGAAFISEFFLFSVAGSLILFEALRSRKREMNRRDEVAERLQNLEEENEIWRRKVEILERKLDEAGIGRIAGPAPVVQAPKTTLLLEGWFTKATGYFSKALFTSEGVKSAQIPIKPDVVPTKA